MKITYRQLKVTVKTRSERSSLIPGLWISRTAIGVNINGLRQPILGFGASFNKQHSEDKSFYELLEHIIFLPYLYDEKTLDQPISYYPPNNIGLNHKPLVVRDVLNGSPNNDGVFYGNGCAIYTDSKNAIIHSKNELIERHLCCELWYKRSLGLIQQKNNIPRTLIPSVEVKLYSAISYPNMSFALAVLDCSETGFFAIGAAVRSLIEDSSKHALCEVGMIYEDFIKDRKGSKFMTSQKGNNILSLRERELSVERRNHFDSLNAEINLVVPLLPEYQSVVFEPIPNIFAARTFSNGALDPRFFQTQNIVPSFPLF